jgi:hypothetical protein
MTEPQLRLLCFIILYAFARNDATVPPHPLVQQLGRLLGLEPARVQAMVAALAQMDADLVQQQAAAAKGKTPRPMVVSLTPRMQVLVALLEVSGLVLLWRCAGMAWCCAAA